MTKSHNMQLNLLADDGTVVERPFEAAIFTGRGFKGMYKLEKDAERLLEAEAEDTLVALVGRFKEEKGSLPAAKSSCFRHVLLPWSSRPLACLTFTLAALLPALHGLNRAPSRHDCTLYRRLAMELRVPWRSSLPGERLPAKVRLLAA
ncbi:MAG: hypothetical protein HC767_04215 [Akkermansiaceae bacterium]|nr:hypothetical protein [Akkermansiaceae bacterium]